MNLLLIDIAENMNHQEQLHEEFTDKAKQAVACKGIRIDIPQWFWRKSQTKAEPYGRTLCWGTEKVYADEENWGSNDTFYLYGVPKEETDDAVLFELDYWNLRKAGRYATDAPTEGGWKAWIPKSVIRNLSDIVVSDPNSSQVQTQQNNNPGSLSEAAKHPIQISDWFGNKLMQNAEASAGVRLFIRSAIGGGTRFYGQVLQTTDKALLISFWTLTHTTVGRWESWVPKSQIISINNSPVK